MISAWDVLKAVLPVYLLVVGGMVARRSGVLRKEHDEGIMRAVYTVMLPCYILDKILGSEVLRSGAMVATAFGLGFALIIAGLAVGLAVGRMIGLGKGTGMRTFALTSGIQNFGFTAAPVVEILWSKGAIAVLFIHNLGVELGMWSVGVMLMSGERGLHWRKLLNGPVIAVLVGLFLVAIGQDQHITGPARRAMSMLGSGAFPLGIFIIGCTIMDLVGAEKPSARVAIGTVLARHVLCPAVFLASARYLPLATEIQQVLVVQAAMPSAMTPIMLARLYGGRPAIAVQIVVISTTLSIITLPWIITLGSRWLQLQPVTP